MLYENFKTSFFLASVLNGSVWTEIIPDFTSLIGVFPIISVSDINAYVTKKIVDVADIIA